MKKTFAILVLFATCGLQGAIKKAVDGSPPKKPAAEVAGARVEKPVEKPAEKPGDATQLEEMLRGARQNGGVFKLDAPKLAELLRGMLEKQGVPKEQLKGADLLQLMRLFREKNPRGFGNGFSGVPFDENLEKRLDSHFKELLEGHRAGAAKAAPATFVFRDARKPGVPLAFGTGVNPDGWLLTKATEVAGAAELQCQVKGEWLAARIVRVWDEHDLALLKVGAKDITAAQWSKSAAPAIGGFVTAVAPEGRDPVAIGVVSVGVRNDRRKGSGFLGVSLMTDDRGLKVREVIPGGAANVSGLLREDRILELDGKKPDSVFTFTKMVSERKAGEKVRLKLQRGEQVMEKEIALGDRGTQTGPKSASFDKLNSMGGTVSKRRDDFPSVLQTDLPLQANQCGGPVTDLDGEIVGLVIARSGRVETMVIPSETIGQVLAGVDFSKENRAAAPKPEAAGPLGEPVK